MVILLVVTCLIIIFLAILSFHSSIRRCIINEVSDTPIPSANGTAVDEIPANSIVIEVAES